MATQPKGTVPQIKTVVIDNFSGELTSELIGKLNSGLQPVSQNPFGKLPFGNPYKVKGLQFIEKPYTLTGTAPTQMIVPTLKSTFGISGDTSAAVVGFDLSGNSYVVQVSDIYIPTPDKDTITRYVGIIGTGAFTLSYGGGIFYDAITGTGGTLMLGTDATGAGTPLTGAYYLNGGGSTSFNSLISGLTMNQVTGTGSTWVANVPRPFCKFVGTLYVGNGKNIIALSSDYKSVALSVNADGSGVLNPSLPSDYVIRSLQVSNDGNYMIILASNGILNVGSQTPLNIFEQAQQSIVQPIDSVIAYWNGSDPALSSTQFFKGLNITAAVSSSTNTIIFGKDINGMGIFDLQGNPLARIDDVGSAVYPPSPHSIDAVGKFFFFMMQVGTSVNIYVFDASANKLYPLYQDTGHTKGSICGALSVPTLHTAAIAGGTTWKDVTRAKLYYFIEDGGALGLGNTDVFQQNAIHLQNYGGVIVGNYATQIEEFGRKIQPTEARVYTLPMTGTTSFTLTLVDTQLNSIASNTYTYVSGSPNMISFTLKDKDVSGFGATLAPGATSLPFFVEKVEVDYMEIENPSPQ